MMHSLLGLRRWLSRGAMVSFAAGTILGCASAPHSNVRSNVEVMQKERTADKLLDRGRAFAAVGDHTRAEQYLSMALDAGGDPAQIVPLLLRACIDGERYLVALEYARNELRRTPDDAHVRYMVASLEMAVGDSKGALEDLRALTDADPDNADVHFALASLVHEKGGDPGEANQHFREYLRLSPAGAHAREAQASITKEVP